MTSDGDKAKRGPEPERLKLKGNWERLVKQALEKKRPPSGWPDASASKKPTGKGKVRGTGR